MTSTMTSSVVIASNAADSAAVETVVQHHAELVAALTARTEALLTAAGSADPSAASAHRADLVRWCWTELLPHAEAEEDTLYGLARTLPEGRLLIESMIAEHRVLTDLIDQVAGSQYAIDAAAKATALQVLFSVHAQKENEIVLPLLAGEPSVSLAEALDRMHEQYAAAKAMQGMGGGGCGCGGHDEAGAGGGAVNGGGCGDGGCGCGGHDEAAPAAAVAPAAGGCGCGGHDEAGQVGDRPVLDARAVPHDIRHATVFGALDAVAPGAGLELIAPHDPVPLLAQIEQRHPGVFEVTYLERGPQAWRLALDRRPARV